MVANASVTPTPRRPEFIVPAGGDRRPGWRIRCSEWLDHQSRQLFITPAVVMILIFSIFPLVASLSIAFSRIRLRGGGYQVRFVGLKNFGKQFFGSEQFHFLGTFDTISLAGWIVIAASGLAILYWLVRYVRASFWWLGFVGRLITAATGFGILVMFDATMLSGMPSRRYLKVLAKTFQNAGSSSIRR